MSTTWTKRMRGAETASSLFTVRDITAEACRFHRRYLTADKRHLPALTLFLAVAWFLIDLWREG
jgi:hypothetical protein